MSNVKNIPVQKQFKAEQELFESLQDKIHEYDGVLSVVAVIGVLELCKQSVIGGCSEESIR